MKSAGDNQGRCTGGEGGSDHMITSTKFNASTDLIVRL